MRSSPSTLCVSFARARWRSLARALATVRSSRRRCSLSAAASQCVVTVSLSSRWYSTSRLPIAAERDIDSRYWAAIAATIRRRSGAARRDGPPPLRRVEATLAAGHGEAGGKPLDVPLPGPRQGLVEVVDVEYELALGRGVGAEVGEVGVAAELRLEPRAGRVGKVRRHHRCGAAVEGERRGQHASVAQRHQLSDARSGLPLQELDRVGALGGGRPPGVARARG